MLEELQGLQEAGFTTVQLEQLCQADRIENTLRLLFALNHWAKAREHLFFADRQGLYQVKAALLSYAYITGLLTARAYIDGREGFGAELAFELAADIAAEGFLWRLEELITKSVDEPEDTYERLVHQLYTRVSGKTEICPADVEKLKAKQIHEYILTSLQELEHEARASGQPIPWGRLTELCIAPSDLLCIQDRRYYDLGDWDSWDQLDSSDLRKLDPEGLSLIAFDYTSPNAHYVFHLPLRIAETFVPREQIVLLKRTPWTSRESGEYYGRAVSEAESLQQPIASILSELGVDIVAVCPRHLMNKEDAAFNSIWRYATEEDDEDEEEAMYWLNLARKARSMSITGACPLCHTLVEAMPLFARVEHWQREHPGQDLTINQAGWLLNCSLTKKVFCLQYPPDYRAPHERGWGTRYWRVETLSGWLSRLSEDSEPVL